MMHRIVFAALLVVTALAVWACESTEEKPDDALSAVDLAAARQACTDGGLDECRAYAHVVLQSDMSRSDLVAARDELSTYCSKDEPALCLTVRALMFRIEQPKSDGTFSPHDGPEAPPAVLVESPRRARYANGVADGYATGKIATLGEVTLAVDVRRDGSIYGVRVVQGVDPVLDRITMDVALDNRYLPARDNAQHVDATMSYRIAWVSGTRPAAVDAGPAEGAVPPPPPPVEPVATAVDAGPASVAPSRERADTSSAADASSAAPRSSLDAGTVPAP